MTQTAQIVDVTYAQTGASVNTDAMGMREMQQRVFAKRDGSPIIYILGKFRIRNLSKTMDEIALEPAAEIPAGEE